MVKKKNTVEITYGAVLNLDVPSKPGYSFKGWYDSPNGGNQIINSSGLVIWNRTNEIEYLYAVYDLIEYRITYSTNLGEFIADNPTVFTVENPITTNDISELRRFGYIFDYWTLNGQEFNSTYGLYHNVTIYAKWLGIEKNIYVRTINTIVDEYAIINLKNANANQNYHFTIAGNVKSITFIGSNKTFYSFRITITSRSNALILGFDSMDIKPTKSTTGNGNNAISTSSNFDLYIIYKNQNKITGGRRCKWD